MLSDSDKDNGQDRGGGDSDGQDKPQARDKSSKPPKGEKKKKEKSWKINNGENGGTDGENKAQQSGAGASGAEGGLKLKINPTDKEDDVKSPGPKSPGAKDKDGKSPAGKGKDLKIKIDKEGDENGGEAESPGFIEDKEEEVSAPIKTMSKREMDRLILTKEARDIKEKLLNYTNEIIVRQNGLDPIANFETFTIETASRKILKELLNEFYITSDKLQQKQGANDDKIKNQRSNIEKLQQLVKKLQTQCASVESFGKRLTGCESKIEVQREAAEKRHESIRDHVARTKEMLEGRVEQVTQFGEKISSMNEEFIKMKKMNDDYKEKIIKEVFVVQSTSAKSESDLKDFKEKSQFFFDKMEFWSQHSTEEIKAIGDKFEGLKVMTTGKIDLMQFELERTVKINDMRQNFDKYNDMLLVKFKQLEDTKQAVRNVITYQKYYLPIETQQIISDNLMKLKAVKQDQTFMIHMKVLFEQATENTRQACVDAQTIEDIDLKEHLEMLNHKKLTVNDWDPFPLDDISEGADFVGDLFTKYMEDIRVRKKECEFGIPPPSVLLRKTIRLNDIDAMIEEVQDKSIGIAISADQMAEKLKAEAKKKELEDTIKRICKRRLDYQHRVTFKRRNSFKGRLQDPLFMPGADLQEFQDKMEESDNNERPKSRQHDRQDKLRPLMREANIDFNKSGRQNMGSQLSQSQASDAMPETNDSQDQGDEDAQGGDPNMLSSIMSAMQTGVKTGGATVQGGGMTDLEKLQFKQEIKEEIRPICKEIADERTNRAIAFLRDQTLKYQEGNELDKKRLIDRLQRELLQVSELLKKQIAHVSDGIREEIRTLHKLRARDKSDNDVVFTKHYGQIQENRVDINKHDNYFETLAQSIAMIAENVNMQMEAEYADLMDRRLMALYGAQPGKAGKADFTTKLDSKTRPKKQRKEYSRSPGNDLDNVSVDYTRQSKPDLTIEESQDNTGQYLDANMNKMDSVLSMQRIMSGPNIPGGGTAVGTNHGHFDDIRQTSGMTVRPKELPVAFDQKCLSHQQQGHDTHLTLKLFKMACLSYKPSKISYREMLIERSAMIEMRRALIDKVSNLLPLCDLFKNNAIYPRRYYDDLMIDEKGYQEHFDTIRSKAGFKTDMMEKLTHLLNASSTNIGSERGLGHSPTHQNQLNKSNNLSLPQIGGNLASKLPFGIGGKEGYDSMSDIQGGGLINRFNARNQSMTLDIADSAHGIDTHGYMGKQSMKVINSTRNRGFNNTDIKRNASMAVVNNMTAPKLFNSSRRNFQVDNFNSTGPQDPTMLKNIYSESKSHLNHSPSATKGNHFQSRNNSTIGGDFKGGKLNIEIGGRGLQGLMGSRPSVPNTTTGGPLKPKVSFDMR